MPMGVASSPAATPYSTARLAASAMRGARAAASPASSAATADRLTDSAMGVMITMTTRSLTSADVTAAAIRNTSIRLPLDRTAPGMRSNARATRVARPCLCMACPKSIEPIRKGRIGWPYRPATSAKGIALPTGSSTNGRKLATAHGTGTVAHQARIHA